MADYRLLVPFCLSAEGGLSDTPGDKGGLTNKGITFAVWITYFGDTKDRFLAMSPADWGLIFKKEVWDKINGDLINSQKIANAIGDWVLNSGAYFPERDVQEVLNAIFLKHLTVDGNFGNANYHSTVDAINSVDQDEEYKDIIARHQEFYKSIVDKDPSQQKFYDGWMNRINNLVKYNSKFLN